MPTTRLELAEMLRVRHGAVVDHLAGTLEHFDALFRRQFIGIDALRQRRVQLFAHQQWRSASQPSASGDQFVGSQQAALLRQPDPARDQRCAVRTAGVVAAVHAHGDQRRRDVQFGERQHQFVRRRFLTLLRDPCTACISSARAASA